MNTFRLNALRATNDKAAGVGITDGLCVNQAVAWGNEMEQVCNSFSHSPDCRVNGAVPMTISDIQALVAARMGVTVLDILSDRQTRAAVLPRHVAMWLARHTTTYSLPAIGLAFGNRDHTTIMNGVTRTEERMAADPGLAADVLAMCNIITNSREIAA